MIAVRINVTTIADGTGSTTLTKPAGGSVYRIHRVEWIDGDFADGVDAVLSVTGTPSGVDQTILTLTDANSDANYYPRILECDNAGSNLATYTLPVVQGFLKLAIAQGGDTKTGGCIVYMD